VTGAELPGQIDLATVAEMRRHGVKPFNGTVVSVTIPAGASGFEHRTELVYPPPAWYATSPPPRLTVVMMIGGEFGHPDDWLEFGGAQKTVDAFAAAHGGNAPVPLLVDSSGAFRSDAECVNGIRGRAADHLTKDVMPYAISNFGVSSDAANWGIVGFSTGGTCALMLTVMHPELFHAFIDIDGQLGPNAGTRQQTIARLFGGDADACAAFDPRTVITKHGVYAGVSAWFAVAEPTPTVYRAANATDPVAGDDPDQNRQSENHAAVANEMCQLGSSHGIECVVVSAPAKHYFSSAASAFAAALPWLAGKLGTRGVPQIAMPGAPAPP
jgi:S-formylglutathione hydrolase FrmB